MLRLIRDTNQAVVACCTPNWECMVIELPSCTPLKSISLDIGMDKKCEQIRFVMIYFLNCDYTFLSCKFHPPIAVTAT